MSVPRPNTHWWRLDTRRVLALALFIALFAMTARQITDPDFWWHLKTGQYIVQTRTIPRHDVFSFTVADHKWITHEWLTQVLMFGLYRLGGLSALLLLATCAVITFTFVLVYLQCDGRPHLAVFIVLLGALTSAMTWGTRPQMLNALMAASFLFVLHRYRAGQRRAVWLLPALTALWANLHSGFVLGLAIIALAIVSELGANWLDHRTPQTLSVPAVRRLALVLALSVAASLLNPNGVKMLVYPFETLGSNAMQQYIQEWASPDFHRLEYWPLAALLLGGAAVMAFTLRKRDLTEALLFYGFGFASLLSARNIPLFAVAATPVITRYAVQMQVGRWQWDLTTLPAPRSPTRAGLILNWALVLLMVLGSGLRVADTLLQNRTVEATRYPLAALDYIETHGLASKRMYNSYNWGGYLLWRGYRVFIDGRADVYMDDFMNEYVLAYQLRDDWRQPLDRYKVDYVLIERDASLATLLEASTEWTRVYQDNLAVIFTRVPAG